LILALKNRTFGIPYHSSVVDVNGKLWLTAWALSDVLSIPVD
jgi:hypothetical protein